MIKNTLRMIFVFSFSSLILLVFLGVSGIVQVRGAEIRPESGVHFNHTSGMDSPAGFVRQKSYLNERLAIIPAEPEADVDLAVILSDFPDPVHAGSLLTYTVDILNNSPETATLVTLTDTLPLEVALVSTVPSQGSCTGPICDLGTLPGGSSANVLLIVHVDSSFVGTIINQVEVTSFDTELNPGDNMDSEVTTVDQEADIAVSTLDDPDPVTAGNLLTYTLIVTNNGPSDASNVTLLDDYPQQKLDFISVSPSPTCRRVGNDMRCNFGNLVAGESRQATLFMRVKSSSVNPLNNPVSVASDTFDPDPTNNQETENTTIIFSSDLSVTTVDDPDPVNPGGTLTYTLAIHNGGPSDSHGVVVTDTLPAELAPVTITPSQGTCVFTVCVLGNILAGNTANVTLVSTVDLGATGVITNTAEVSSDESDPIPGNDLDYETTIIGEGADLSVTQSGVPSPVIAGELLTYEITISNLGPMEAPNVELLDTLPSDVAFVSSVPGDPTCSHVSGSVTCNLGTLSVGVSSDVTIVVLVNPDAIGPLTNLVEVSSVAYDSDLTNNQAIEVTDVIYSSDLSVTTVDDPDPVDPGGTLTYTLTINNDGPSVASGVVVTDTLPAELALVSITPSQGTCVGTVCTLGMMLADGSASVTLVSTVDLGMTGVITNTAQVSSDEPDPLPGNNLDYETTTIGEGVDLSVTMSDDPDPVIAGELLLYSITVENLSTSNAPNVVLLDTLPSRVSFVSSNPGSPSCVFASGSVTCNLGNLSAGASTDVAIIVRVDSGADISLTNLANVSSGAFDPDLSNNQVAEDTAIIFSSDLSLSTVDDPDPVYPGGTLFYTLTIDNSGPSDAYTVVVTDSLPAEVNLISITPSQGTCDGTVCDLGPILAGGDANVVLETIVEMDAMDVITNTAQVSISDDPDPLNNTDLESTTIDLLADLSIVKSDFPDPVTAGGLLTYTLIITNNGPLSASGVTVTDTLPLEVSLLTITPSQGMCDGTVCNLGMILAGNDANVVLVTLVDDGASGPITNNAQVSSLEFDPVPDNNFDNELTFVGEEIDRADLAITKNDFPDPVAPGGLLTYTLVVTNTGPDTALNVTITDTLPEQVTFISSQPEPVCSEISGVVTCGPWNLAPAETTAVNIIVEVDLTAFGQLVNQAQVASDVLDPEPENNQASEPTNVIASADLAVSTLDDPGQVEPGGMLSYSITVTNNGPFPNAGVTLIDTLPDEVTLLEAHPSQGSCIGSVCSLGIIAADDSAQVTLLGLVALDASGVITNTAQVFGQLLDPIPENNLDLEFTTVGAGADLAISKASYPDPVVAGEILTYSLTVQNLGPSIASDVNVVDTLPEHVVFISSTPSEPVCTQSAGTVLCNLGNLASGGIRNVTIVVRVNASATGVMVNQAIVSSITFDSDEANNIATEETTVMEPDTETPTVNWVLPVGNEQSFNVRRQNILLEVEATDNIAIERVEFMWYDPELSDMVAIATIYAPPYHVYFDTGVLYYGYNQVYVRAYDTSENASNRPRILLFRLEGDYLQYLPMISR